MSYKIIKYSPDLDLTDFYNECSKRGFENNSSQQVMFDCFKNEREWAGWLIEYQGKIVAGVCAHSFDDVMGENSYRILTRTCVLTNLCHKSMHNLKSFVYKHQSIASQFFIPLAVQWAGVDKKFYGTSNNRAVGHSQKTHNLWFPKMTEQGTFSYKGEAFYRGWNQSIWELNTKVFLNQLQKFDFWEADFPEEDPRLLKC